MAEDNQVATEPVVDKLQDIDTNTDTQINNNEINNDNKYVDKEAYEEIKQQMLSANKKLSEQDERIKEIDRIKKAIVGEDLTTGMTEKEKEKFFSDLAENPTETLKKLTKEITNNDLEEIKQWKKQQEINQANSTIVNYLTQTDPDFNNVYNNMAKYLKPNEFERYKDTPDGFEVLYAKAKMRMENENKQKQQQTQTATNIAKNIANQTANSEIPLSSGRTQEAATDDIDRNIATAREEGFWNRGEGFSKLDEDIFAQYQRDVYGIKPKK